MRLRITVLILACLGGGELCLRAQEVQVFGRTVQFHGFASQGFIHTDANNWLTMNTAHFGSGEYTDFGLNASVQVTDRLHVGAQGYDRNLGELGKWHPSLDWGYADYRLRPWFGIRGGKVKTTLGLYNDTQDLDFLHTFVLLPQSVYPTDLRDSSIAHEGGDIYGKIALRRHLGGLAYTAYGGNRSDSIYSGYPYLLTQYFVFFRSLGGLQYGGDLRWNLPVKGLMIGGSRLNEDITGKGSFINVLNPAAGRQPYQVSSKSDWMNQFYGQYATGKLRVDAEYRRYFRDEPYPGNSAASNDVRGWYVAGCYRIMKRLDLGAYYSRYTITSILEGELAQAGFASQTDTSLPANHIYDRVVAARVDLNKFWNAKIEGHFMEGYGASTYPDGFYPQVNPQGFRPDTNALVVKTSLNF